MLKTLFAMTFVTSRIMFPGIPIIPTEAGSDVSDFKNVSQMLNINISYDGNSENPQATIIYPEASTLENISLVLEKNARNQPIKDTDEKIEVILKLYSGSNNQPHIESKKTLKKYMETFFGKANDIEYKYNATNTIMIKSPQDGYKSIPIDGKYTFSTTFGDTASIEVNKTPLLPLEIANLVHKYDFSQPTTISWKPIADIDGYLVKATGIDGNNIIIWSSGGEGSHFMDLSTSLITPKTIKKHKEKWLLPKNITSCTIPNGIFTNTKTVIVSVFAFSCAEVKADEKTTTSIMLRSEVLAPFANANFLQ